MAYNPYAPPSAEPQSPPQANLKLASLGKRLGASVIDGLFLFLLGAAISRVAWGDSRTVEQVRWAFLGVTACQWVLVSLRGQSLGKIVLGIRIVTRDNRAVGFYRGVALRSWPALVIQLAAALLVPLLRPLVPLIAFADVLFVFRQDRRCLHDLVAGTYVVDA
jgi:uncharacterized RDD family membrane protein YckC